MNITQESTGELTASIKVSVTEDDYREKINKALKEYQKKASFKGFRPGKVPISMIQNLYGKAMLAEEVNKLLSESLSNYITDNKINILGQPLPNREMNDSVDFDNMKAFDFHFDIGLAPEITLDLSENIEAVNHEIEIEDDMLDKEITYMRKRYGKYIKGETVENTDMVHGEFEELDEAGNIKENGLKHHANVSLEITKNELIKSKLIGTIKGFKIIFKTEELLKDEDEAINFLGVKKDEIKNIKSDFQFIVEEINRIETAEINEELFKKAFPKHDIKDEVTFKEKIKESLKESLKKESDKKLNDEIMDKLLDTHNVSLPSEFLKKWLKETNEKLTDEQIEEEFSHFLRHMKWDIIENKIIKDNNLEVAHTEAKDLAKVIAKNQMLSYGLSEEHITDDYLETFSEDMMKKEDTVRKIYENLYNEKVMSLIKSKIKIKNKQIKLEDFFKLETHNH